MPKLREAAAAATVAATAAALGLALSGCASGPSLPIRLSDDSAANPRSSAPTEADAQTWAEAVVPDDALGGSGFTQREAGVLEPGDEPVVVLTADGSQDRIVTVACVSAEVSSMTYAVVSSDGTEQQGEVACPAVGSAASPHEIVGVPAGATIELDGTAPGLYVCAVRPAGADRAR